MNSADEVFNILDFQYKPLEKKFLEFCKKENKSEIIEKYPKLSSVKKITILDKYASFIGL